MEGKVKKKTKQKQKQNDKQKLKNPDKRLPDELLSVCKVCLAYSSILLVSLFSCLNVYKTTTNEKESRTTNMVVI